MTDELIEQVERAIRQALSDGAPWDSEPEDFTEEAKVCAPAALAAINLPAQLEAARTQGWNEAIEAAADWFADRFSDAVQADCESGVKWLNERAAKAYLKDAPDTLAAIREGEEAIRALTKDSTHDD